MKKPPRKSTRLPPEHRADDAADLWRHVTRSVTPVRKKARVLDIALPPAAVAQRHHGAGPEPATREPAAARTPEGPRALRNTPQPRSAGSLQTHPDFDRRTTRKIAKGNIEIEARIDLHGMRLDDAHAELVSFLRRCHSAGRRLVLVITGKGRDTPDRYAPFDMAVDRSRRGVIRASVPRWLEEPELQAIVVSYSEAVARHGGEGALYVRLRKAR